MRTICQPLNNDEIVSQFVSGAGINVVAFGEEREREKIERTHANIPKNDAKLFQSENKLSLLDYHFLHFGFFLCSISFSFWGVQKSFVFRLAARWLLLDCNLPAIFNPEAGRDSFADGWRINMVILRHVVDAAVAEYSNEIDLKSNNISIRIRCKQTKKKIHERTTHKHAIM